MAADFLLEPHGTIALLRPMTKAAFGWVEDHLPDDRLEFGGAVVVEPRYVADIVTGIRDDGLQVARGAG